MEYHIQKEYKNSEKPYWLSYQYYNVYFNLFTYQR